MGTLQEPFEGDPVVAIYRRALPQVYGYLLPRCGDAVVAEDLTAETFTAAVTASRQGSMAVWDYEVERPSDAATQTWNPSEQR